MPSVTDSAPATTHCEKCGTELPSEADRCPRCGEVVTIHPARLVLGLILLLIIAGFAFTQYFTNLHRTTESDLAVRWFKRGGEAMQAHLPAAAAEDYRTALSYDPENQEYRLRLAQALMEADQWNEARAQLLALWEEEPANGEVNLTLARLFARRGDPAKAIHYYNNAIDGVWSQNPRARRTATRFELAHYLMQQKKLAQAQAELLTLQAEGPSNPADQLHLADLLLQANQPGHAREAYNAVLAKDRDNAQAWLGKGQAALALGDYSAAEHALANAIARDANLADARDQLAMVRQVLRLDPTLRGLSLAERSKRVAAAFRISLQRLTSCAAQQGYTLATPNSAAASQSSKSAAIAKAPPALTPALTQLQRLYAAGLRGQASATERALRENPDALDPTMQYVFDVERATAPICPAMDVADSALLTLAQRESGAGK
ncbi:MAG TPA: tetratricopeptide repeat protein [Terriglobales bacterium]|nr:tetratricopeptide repeat protein [Terriglobales bacterium]